MMLSTTAKRWLAAGAAVMAVGGGGTLAMAQSVGNSSTAPTVQSAQRPDTPEPGDRPDSRNSGVSQDRPEAGDTADANRVSGGSQDRPEAGDTADANSGNVAERADNQESTASERGDGAGEATEAASLSKVATVSRAQAEQAALGKTPGTVTEASLGDENGTVIWEVNVKASSGGDHEVKVDAKTGAVLQVQSDTQD
ncbi:MAG: PepSY domain-containing protein [Thermoleophilia bacterium]